MSQAPVGSDVHEPADIHLNFAAEVTLDQVTASLDCRSDAGDFFVVELSDFRVALYARDLSHLYGPAIAHTVDGAQRHIEPFVVRNVYAGNQCDRLVLNPAAACVVSLRI